MCINYELLAKASSRMNIKNVYKTVEDVWLNLEKEKFKKKNPNRFSRNTRNSNTINCPTPRKQGSPLGKAKKKVFFSGRITKTDPT